MNIRILYTIVTFCCLIYSPIHAKNYSINVIGNNYIDQQIVISLFVNLPEDIANIDENQLLKELYDTGYFEDIEISLSSNELIIKITEYPIFKEVHFKKNKRFK